MLQDRPLGAVTALWCYPVKSLAAEALQRAQVEANGFARDRDAAMFVANPAGARYGKEYRGKENNLLHTVASLDAGIRLAERRGVAVEVRAAGPYFDLGAVSILFDTWLAEAERLVGSALDPLRYRPNVFVRAAAGFAASEGDLAGRRIAIGDVTLRVTQSIERCVTPTYDIATGASDPNVQRALVQHRANTMGIYCDVVHPGTIAVGDTLHAARIDE